jgi:hypothetical protein
VAQTLHRVHAVHPKQGHTDGEKAGPNFKSWQRVVTFHGRQYTLSVKKSSESPAAPRFSQAPIPLP